MSKKQLPPQETLCQFLRYDQESGKLFWKERSPEMVCDGGPRRAKRTSNQLNSLLAGKEAFTFTDRRGYRHGTFLGKAYQAHRVIWKMVYGVDPDTIDHIDGDQGNNRIANLRSCSNAENSRNYAKPEGGSSKYRGVCWVKRDKAWAARISAGDLGKINLGYFHNEIDAVRAYDRAAIVHHGEFAKTNFPRTDYEARIRASLVDAPATGTTPIPAGWKLAPIEPTPEMIDATYFLRSAYSIYSAMLAAAPEPPAASIPETPDSSPSDTDNGYAEIGREIVSIIGHEVNDPESSLHDWAPAETYGEVISDLIDMIDEAKASTADRLMEQMAEAAQDIINRMSSTFQRRGKEIGIQADDGEKCWIVHSDDITRLEGALDAYKARKAGAA